MAQQAAPIRIGHRHAPEARAVDAGDAVVAREPLVDERVVGIEQIEREPVLADDAREEQLGFPAERLAHVVVEVREQQQVRRDLVQIAQLQPLAGERVHQRVGARIGDHAPHLRLEHARRAQPAGDRQVQQLVVRDAAPEEERQPARQLEIGDAMRRAGGQAARVLLRSGTGTPDWPESGRGRRECRR